MRPATAPRKPKSEELENFDEATSSENVAKVDETQFQQQMTYEHAEDVDKVDDLEPLQEAEDHNNKENTNPGDLSSLPSANESAEPDCNSDADELASTPPPRPPKKPRSHPTPEGGTKPSTAARSVKASSSKRAAAPTNKERKPTNKGTINPNAHSHQNFRSLKIRSKNSKGKKGGGRFGRGRR